jgi:hypothetical protein
VDDALFDEEPEDEAGRTSEEGRGRRLEGDSVAASASAASSKARRRTPMEKRDGPKTRLRGVDARGEDGNGNARRRPRSLDPLSQARLAAGDDMDVDEYSDEEAGGDGSGSDVDPDDGVGRGSTLPSTRGRLSRAERASLAVQDDWFDAAYEARLQEAEEADAQEGRAEGGKPPDVVLDGGLRIPHRIAGSLFPYQMTGVRWMWELHRQRVGGILGDEMGLVSGDGYTVGRTRWGW